MKTESNIANIVSKWDKSINLAMIKQKDKEDTFDEFIDRGTLTYPPSNRNDIDHALNLVQSQKLSEIYDFYEFTNGMLIPVMDAEHGSILSIEKITRASHISDAPTFSSFELSNGVLSLSNSEFIDSIVLSPQIDSALIVWVPSRKTHPFWALFHHGEDVPYRTFSELLEGELSRVYRSILSNS